MVEVRLRFPRRRNVPGVASFTFTVKSNNLAKNVWIRSFNVTTHLNRFSQTANLPSLASSSWYSSSSPKSDSLICTSLHAYFFPPSLNEHSPLTFRWRRREFKHEIVATPCIRSKRHSLRVVSNRRKQTGSDAKTNRDYFRKSHFENRIYFNFQANVWHTCVPPVRGRRP